MQRILFLLVLLVPFPALAFGGGEQGRKLKHDEEIYFYPTLGAAEDGSLLLRGRVSDPERGSFHREKFLAGIGKALGFTEEERNSELFRQRGSLFLEEEAEGARVTLTLAGGEKWMLKTDDEGYFEAWTKLDEFAGKEQFVRFVSHPDKKRAFHGSAWILAAEGFSIVSDIDDTVKITNVLDRPEMFRNTFTRPFRAVPGMAPLFKKMLAKGGSLHFLSAGPRQLAPVLQPFLEQEGFPAFSLHMRPFHLDKDSIANATNSSVEFKTPFLRALLQKFPKRKFLLIGDSGEKDPEIYATILAEFPEQVGEIWIRDVTGESANSERFKKIPKTQLRVFREVSELPQ